MGSFEPITVLRLLGSIVFLPQLMCQEQDIQITITKHQLVYLMLSMTNQKRNRQLTTVTAEHSNT